MGNCITCFHSSDTTDNVSGRRSISQSLSNVNTGGQTKGTGTAYYKQRETDELLPANYMKQTDIQNDNTRNTKSILNPIVRSSEPIELINSGKDKSKVSDNTLNTLFEKYKDIENDAILSEGIIRLCEDLGYNPTDFEVLVLAWSLNASRMCCFTRSEFIQGLQKMNADSIETIRIYLRELVQLLKQDTEKFKNFYRFTFGFGLDVDGRILDRVMAISLWNLVFTIHTPPILGNWIKFLETNDDIRGIQKDTWNMFLNFAENCDITSYDQNEAWPSLFDDFVEYENDRLNQNNLKQNVYGETTGGL